MGSSSSAASAGASSESVGEPVAARASARTGHWTDAKQALSTSTPARRHPASVAATTAASASATADTALAVLQHVFLHRGFARIGIEIHDLVGEDPTFVRFDTSAAHRGTREDEEHEGWCTFSHDGCLARVRHLAKHAPRNTNVGSTNGSPASPVS
jgi:hypothetical protein